MMRILVAPNAFKHSLNAGEAAVAIKKGLMQSRLEAVVECFPIGDGGDGTTALIMQNRSAELQSTNVHDPLGRSINSYIGWIDEGKTAVIEMADASGLRLLKQDELNPLLATSFGTGEQMKAALDKNARKIIVAMGGSATVDGACGILQALGIRFLDASGEVLTGLPGNLPQLDRIDLSGLDNRILKTELIVLCDVDNQLLGNNGAAAMFGPQKGASPQAVLQLDAALTRLADLVFRETGRNMASVKYGGTAGGAAAGLYGLLNAKLVNGIEYFLSLTGFDASLDNADLVITGEGSIDQQTLQGKGPFGVANRAKQKHLPVVAMAGSVPLETSDLLQQHFDVLLAIGQQPASLEAALADTEKNLIRTATALGNMLAIRKY